MLGISYAHADPASLSAQQLSCFRLHKISKMLLFPRPHLVLTHDPSLSPCTIEVDTVDNLDVTYAVRIWTLAIPSRYAR